MHVRGDSRWIEYWSIARNNWVRVTDAAEHFPLTDVRGSGLDGEFEYLFLFRVMPDEEKGPPTR